MSQELTLKGIALEKLDRILNPSFDLRFIWALLSGGVLLAGYQRIIQLCSSLEVVSGGTYVKLSLSAGTDAALILIGAVMIFSSIVIFIVRQINSQPKAIKKYKSLKHAAKRNKGVRYNFPCNFPCGRQHNKPVHRAAITALRAKGNEKGGRYILYKCHAIKAQGRYPYFHTAQLRPDVLYTPESVSVKAVVEYAKVWCRNLYAIRDNIQCNMQARI